MVSNVLARLSLAAALTAAMLLSSAPPARSQLEPVHEFKGRGNWTIDAGGVGSVLLLDVPAGSTIEQAFLYSSTALAPEAPAGVTPTVTLGAVTYGPAEFTPLTFVMFRVGFGTGMQGFRADATAQVAAAVGSGGAGPYPFFIVSEDYAPPGRPTGTALVVIYTNPTESYRCITLFDGGAALDGNAFTLELDQPLDPDLPGFEALLSVGIGYSTGDNLQQTRIDVNGRRLTSVAGGDDDTPELLTVGGRGDDPANPDDPFDAPFLASDLDDELYDLARGDGTNPLPFLSGGETAITVATENISEDDNLFFAGLNVVVPEAECLLVIGDGPGAATYFDIGHLFKTQLDGVEDAYEVLLDDIPQFVLPAPAVRTSAPRPGPLSGGSWVATPAGDGPVGTTPAWMADGEFAVQVLMWNPEVFPGQPEQFTAGLHVSVHPDGSVVTTPFGTDQGGMQVWHELDTNGAGQQVIRFPFSIPGFAP